MPEDSLAPLPVNAVAELRRARYLAVDAIIAAEDAERVARARRRTATAKQKHYEALLEEHNGQLRIED